MKLQTLSTKKRSTVADDAKPNMNKWYQLGMQIALQTIPNGVDIPTVNCVGNGCQKTETGDVNSVTISAETEPHTSVRK